MPVNLRFMISAYFTRESFDVFLRLIHHLLGGGNFTFETPGVDGGHFFQCQQSDVDSEQSLSNFVLEIAANLFSFVLLCHEDSMSELSQAVLEAVRFREELLGISPAFPESLLDRLPPNDAFLERPMGGRQVDGAPVESLVPLAQTGVALKGGAMSLFNRGNGLDKEDFRALDNPIPASGGFQIGKRSLVNPDDVQGLQPEGHGLTTETTRLVEVRPRALLQVSSQCRGVASRK